MRIELGNQQHTDGFHANLSVWKECLKREDDPGLSPQEKVEEESENGGNQEPPMNWKEKQKNMYASINSRETVFVEG